MIELLDEYQNEARKTATYPSVGTHSWVYVTLGLAGETGEICEKLKKIIRDKNGVISEDDRQALKKEQGDLLWYISNLAYELGFKLSEIATANIEKLRSRQERNVIGGSGDNR